MAKQLDARALYAEMREERRDYLDEADKVAALTITDIRPTGTSHESQPYTHIGTMAVESLTAVVHNVTMPQSVRWYEFGIDPGPLIEAGVDTLPTNIEAELVALQNQMSRLLDHTRARMLNVGLVENLLIEHQNLIVIDKPTDKTRMPRLRVYPLRSFVIERIAGQEHRVVLREEDFEAEDTENIYQAEIPGEEGDVETLDDGKAIYTLIDHGEGKVYQQKANQKEATLVPGEHPDQYVVATTRIPLDSSYLNGYAHRYYGTMFTANKLMKGLIDGGLMANWIVLLVSSGEDPGIVARLENATPGEPLIIAVGDARTAAQFLTTGAKIGDWSFVGALIKSLEETLDKAFAVGIAKRKPKTRTAEEVIQMRNELETQTTIMADTVADTWRKVILGLMRVMNMGLVIRDGRAVALKDLPADDQPRTEDNIIQPTVVTGMTAINRETQFRMALEGIAMIAQIDQSILDEIDGIALLRKWMGNIAFDIDSILKGQQKTGVQPLSEDEQNIGTRVQSGDLTPEEGAQALRQLRQVNEATTSAAGEAAREVADRPAA